MKSTAIARGESFRQRGLSIYAAKIRTANEITANKIALYGFILPDGSSRFAVLGFAASIFLSIILFKPIAPDRAATIATTIQNICFAEGIPEAARSAPVNANGSAKIE